jgi:tetratricopeptide (TPR) repeat protein
MKRIIIFVLLLLSGLLNAQITVKGIVTEQNSGNKPIQGVQIKALGSTPELTDNAGLFQLIFANKKAGDRIIVSEISKKGYEIVNKDLVNNWLITNNLNERTKIVMCPEGIIAQNTLKYYDISLSGLTKGYNDRNKLLKEQLDKSEIDVKTFSKLADSLAQQFQNQQKQLEELSDKFARENFDDCSEIHQKAFDAFRQGNIEEAILLLETVNSEAEITKANIQQIKAEHLINEGEVMRVQSKNIIQQNIDKLKFQADLYVTSFRFQEAEQCFETIMNADTSNFDHVFAFAVFLNKQKQYNKGINILNKALTHAKTDHNKSTVLNNLAFLYFDINQYDKAEYAYTEALNINRALAKINPQIYNSDVAKTLNSLATLQFDMNQFNKAEANYNDALKINRTLAKTNPQLYHQDLFETFHNLAILQCEMNQYDKAEANYIEALEINRALAIANPMSYNITLVKALNYLANLQSNQKNYVKAETNYTEALQICRKFTKSNPRIYNMNLARTCIRKSANA